MRCPSRVMDSGPEPGSFGVLSPAAVASAPLMPKRRGKNIVLSQLSLVRRTSGERLGAPSANGDDAPKPTRRLECAALCQAAFGGLQISLTDCITALGSN